MYVFVTSPVQSSPRIRVGSVWKDTNIGPFITRVPFFCLKWTSSATGSFGSDAHARKPSVECPVGGSLRFGVFPKSIYQPFSLLIADGMFHLPPDASKSVGVVISKIGICKQVVVPGREVKTK